MASGYWQLRLPKYLRVHEAEPELREPHFVEDGVVGRSVDGLRLYKFLPQGDGICRHELGTSVDSKFRQAWCHASLLWWDSYCEWLATYPSYKSKREKFVWVLRFRKIRNQSTAMESEDEAELTCY